MQWSDWSSDVCSSDLSNALSRSGARIRVYGDNRLLGTFNVPNGQGARWNVLDINRGGLADVNTITANR
jgi:hypothetical protein